MNHIILKKGKKILFKEKVKFQSPEQRVQYTLYSVRTFKYHEQ